LASRVIETLNTIILEAELQGSRLSETPPRLFEDAEQRKYEEIREHFRILWSALKRVAVDEDQMEPPSYPKFERLLSELDVLNREYVRLIGPRFAELLADASNLKVS
jgi:hypothetical protein